MNESGPIRKTEKDLPMSDSYTDLAQIAPHLWRADRAGKHLMLKTADGNDAASLQLLKREYEISCNLQHPFVLSAIAFDESSPVGPAIVMEYVDGRTLRSFAADKPSGPARRKVLREILDAVEYLHKKGLLHNDIKPENVLVTTISDDVKIIDFGLAETDADFLNQRLGGTQGYSAPEVLSGPSEGSRSSAAADIFSLGGIIELLLPGRYRRIVRKCFSIEPSLRYPNVDALRRALRRRDTVLFMIAAIGAAVILFAAAIVPNHINNIRIRHAAEAKDLAQQAAIKEVQQQMELWYQAAADSITNPDLIPYKDYAYLVRNTFVMQTAEYQRTLGALHRPVYDTVYARLLNQLTDKMSTLPTISDLHVSGYMSDAEYQWHLMRLTRQESYAPYTGR